MGKTIQTVLTFAALWTAVFAASSSWLWAPDVVQRGLWFLLWAYAWLCLVVALVVASAGDLKRRMIYSDISRRVVTSKLAPVLAFANIGLIAASGAFWLASLFTFVSALNLIYRIDAHTARKAEQGGPAKRGDLN